MDTAVLHAFGCRAGIPSVTSIRTFTTSVRP